MITNIRFDDWLAEQKQSSEFRDAYAKYEVAQQVIRLRVARGLTQAQLAERVGTTQSSIARLESGSREPSLSFLRRVVNALGGQLEVRVAAPEVVPEEISAGTFSMEANWSFAYQAFSRLLPSVAESREPYLAKTDRELWSPSVPTAEQRPAHFGGIARC